MMVVLGLLACLRTNEMSTSLSLSKNEKVFARLTWVDDEYGMKVGITWRRAGRERHFQGQCDRAMAPVKYAEFIKLRNSPVVFLVALGSQMQTPPSYIWRVKWRSRDAKLVLPEGLNLDWGKLWKGTAVELNVGRWLDDPPSWAGPNTELQRTWTYDAKADRFKVGPWRRARIVELDGR